MLRRERIMPEQKSDLAGGKECARRAVDLADKRERLEVILLENMRREAGPLRELLDAANSKRYVEDRMYRFYHQSLKVYDLQEGTAQIVAALAGIAPEGQPFC